VYCNVLCNACCKCALPYVVVKWLGYIHSMRIQYYIISYFLLIQIFCAVDLSPADSRRISDYRKHEMEVIQKIVRELGQKLKSDSTRAWVAGDCKYYSIWESALIREIAKDYESAIRLYKKAYGIMRDEISSYYVLLPLGRVYFLSKKNKLAKLTLKKYIKEAEKEYNGDNDAEW